jgi:hypothetical protein
VKVIVLLICVALLFSMTGLFVGLFIIAGTFWALRGLYRVAVGRGPVRAPNRD